jgi:predicted ATPase/DNA-binding SARP family transcriptional activator/class 3 adenylate cyclase
MEFRILGPLEVLDDHGRPLVLSGAKQRALLAVLLLRAGEVVSTDRLIDELWGEEPPETARSVLQVHVANLRKVLEPARPKRAASYLLRTKPPGYLFDLGPHGFDLVHFEQFVAHGRDGLAAGDPQAAAIALRRALALWRGPVLGDAAAELTNKGVLARLEEQRLAALEQRIEADLALGRHSELVGELEALVTAHPLRERLRGQLMVALYRCGRQAEALEVYRQTRETLGEELGIDPSRALQDLERAILAQDPALDWVPPANDAATVSGEVPPSPAPTPEPSVPAEVPTGPEPSVPAGLLVQEVATAGETRRTVSVLCLGVTATRDGEELDPELWRQLAGSYVGELQEVIERHGGTILESRDEATIVVYGVPSVHENDALRAVRAAAEARHTLGSAVAEIASAWGVHVAFSAGIQTGEAVIEIGEGRQPRLAGAPARLARQLEQAAASGEILLDTTTCGLVRDAVRVEQARPLVVRGRREPVAAWRLVGVHPHAPGRAWRLDAPMVGRSRQLARLAGAFEAAVADQTCQLVTVLGPAGVGKSRLTHEFLEAVGERATVLRGRCLDYGEGITFWPIAEVVRQATNTNDSDAPAEVLRQLRTLLAGEEHAELLAVRVAALLGLTEAAGAAEEFFWAIRKLLEALARRRPLVVVIDDLHWAEPSLLDLVEHVADWSRDAPILLCCLARTELLDIRPGWAGGKWNATSLLLEPLSHDDCTALVDHLLGRLAGAEDTRAQITQAAEGNPLHVEELVAMLIDEQILTRRSGHWVTTRDLSAIPVPPTVQTLLAARLDALTPSEQHVLRRASVVGQVFYRGAVTELSPEPDRSEVAARLMQLTRKQLIRPERSAFAGEETFRFRHLLIRDAAYQALPKHERASLHERFAGWLERVSGERLTEYEEILGYHLEQAYRYRAELGPIEDQHRGLALRAAERLTASGHRARERDDLPAAIGLLTRARALLDNDARGLEVAAMLGEALTLAGQFERAERLLGQALAAVSGVRDPRLEARIQLARLQLAFWAASPGWMQEVRRGAEAAIAILEQVGDHDGLALCWTLLARVSGVQGQSAALAKAAERGLEHARKAGHAARERQCLELIIIALQHGPTPVPEALRRCEEIAQHAAGHHRLEAYALRALALLHAMQGRFDNARRLATRCRRLADDLGVEMLTAVLSMELAMMELLAGDAAAAERELRPGYEVFEQKGEDGYRASSAAFLGEAAYAQGRFGEAEQWARISETLAEADDVDAQVRSRLIQAKLLVKADQLHRAVALAREAVTLADTTDLLTLRADAWRCLADVLRQAGHTAEAVQAAEEAVALYQRKDNLASARKAQALLADLMTVDTGKSDSEGL